MIDHIKQVFTLEISYKTACGPAEFTVPQNDPWWPLPGQANHPHLPDHPSREPFQNWRCSVKMSLIQLIFLKSNSLKYIVWPLGRFVESRTWPRLAALCRAKDCMTIWILNYEWKWKVLTFKLSERISGV